MANNDVTSLFIFLIFFWGSIAFLSAYFDIQITKSSLADYTPDNQNNEDGGIFSNFISEAFNFLSGVPIIKYFVPLFKIMTFNYGSEIPALMSIFIDIMALISVFIVWNNK